MVICVLLDLTKCQMICINEINSFDLSELSASTFQRLPQNGMVAPSLIILFVIND